jgi:Ca2+-binding EF-hand superfamily protein
VTYAGKKYESAEQLVEEVFEEMDTSGEGKITLSDYRVAANKNPDIIQGLKLFSD